MLSPTSNARLDQLYPPLAKAVRTLAETLASEGIRILVVQGLRTVAEQDALFARGRTAPGSIVTNAAGGHSWHNFGLAVDLAPLAPDGTIDWNSGHPQWKRMEAVGVSLGLTSGANWKRLVDAPHFQISGRFPEAAPDDEVRALMQDGGMGEVWKAVSDSRGGEWEL